MKRFLILEKIVIRGKNKCTLQIPRKSPSTRKGFNLVILERKSCSGWAIVSKSNKTVILERHETSAEIYQGTVREMSLFKGLEFPADSVPDHKACFTNT